MTIKYELGVPTPQIPFVNGKKRNKPKRNMIVDASK